MNLEGLIPNNGREEEGRVGVLTGDAVLLRGEEGMDEGPAVDA